MITLVLIYTAFLDIKYREVDPKIWSIAIPLTILLSLNDYTHIAKTWQADLKLHILGLTSIVVVFLGMLVLYYVDMIGGADIFLLLMLIVGYPNSVAYYCSSNIVCIAGYSGTPASNYLPFVVIIMMNTVIAALLLVLAIGTINILVFREQLRRVPGFHRKLIYSVSALPLRVDKIAIAKYWFPLETCISKDCSTRDYKDLYKISDEEDFIRRREMLKELVEKGVLDPSTRVWATYGLPFIALVLVGLLISIIFGDKLFVALAKLFLI